MEYIGITKEELTSICKKWAPVLRSSEAKMMMNIELFAIRFHDEEIADVKRHCPNWTPDDDDAPVMDHAVAWMALKEIIKKANKRRTKNVVQ